MAGVAVHGYRAGMDIVQRLQLQQQHEDTVTRLEQHWRGFERLALFSGLFMGAAVGFFMGMLVSP